MPITVRQVHPLFVGEVTGVEMCVPPDATAMREIVAAANRYAVLVFRE